MKANHILVLLDKYLIKYPLESNSVERFKNLISNSNCFNLNNEIGHITASSFIVDIKKENALLTHHEKINKWIQLGGHIDSLDKSIQESAKREAFEESSLSSLKLIDEQIFDLDIHKIHEKDFSYHFHFDIRFLFTADKKEKFIITKESKDLKWIPLNSFEAYNPEWSLIKMREKIASHFR